MTTETEAAADLNALAAIHAQIQAAKAQDEHDAINWAPLEELVAKLDADGVLRHPALAVADTPEEPGDGG